MCCQFCGRKLKSYTDGDHCQFCGKISKTIPYHETSQDTGHNFRQTTNDTEHEKIIMTEYIEYQL